MLKSFIRHGKAAVAALSVLLAACGGGGGGGSDAPAPGTGGSPGQATQALAAAAANPANDTSRNASAPFTVLQSAGVPAVTVKSPPKVTFAVFSDGKLVDDLTLANVRFAFAKLVPGTNGDPDQWVSYIYRKETPKPTVGPNNAPVLPDGAMQATTDPQPASAAATQLVRNADGSYTYTFSTDVKDPAKTNNVVFEPQRTHRVAIQLSYKNAAGETVLVNPYFDFTIDANGNSVPVTDPALTRKMTDVSSCNSCHEKLAMHGGGRVDTQFCVMCHNPGTTDANSGNVLTLSTMVHKIHAGKLLKSRGEEYAIWGYGDNKISFAEVGFPQDLRNCTKCHSGSNPATPQGDNWKSRASREACLTCHDGKASTEPTSWFVRHTFFNKNRDPNAAATLLPNSECARCHAPGGAISPERVHFNQNEDNAAKYKMNIEAASYDAASNAITVKYFLSDPTRGNAAYNLVTPDCTGTPVACSGSTKFGNLRLIVAYGSLAGQPANVTEYTSGSAAQVFAYTGTNDGSNHYTATITLPTPSATHVISGTARIATIGQVKEPKLALQSAADPRPEVTPRTLVNVVVQNTSKEIALTGTLQPRRTIVSSEKCNVCHGALGTTSGANTLSEAFHGGARNTVEACVVCHEPNKMSSTLMTNGLGFNESYQFKRMIHGIHGNSRRTFPFTHGNKVGDRAFNKDGTAVGGGAPLAADVENYAAEVAWPGVGINCNACHVDNSYKLDKGTVGSVIRKPAGETDPMNWLVISPKAASCTACHDSPKAMGHVTSFGNASFGDRTQAQSTATVETCADCHSSGLFKGVDIVHGQK
ncbi:MAG TPA: OmcA/MtrC family decaheme c-type cytochrome [Ramlibacter sp.]|uniref:OmcA/MtrC family decaheme c-type cytochrome n=1 Tax=Ramlibacter sp. TaxID=1917967 RepID=UPI002D7E83F7|nr:OmcA/MtrC family decaheme c-type cytochrome [Ramlibacter sp.]HET8747235.1 OmcA/MtrC family decaheme c-type cytochrome [Ramlibacter sp.]